MDSASRMALTAIFDSVPAFEPRKLAAMAIVRVQTIPKSRTDSGLVFAVAAGEANENSVKVLFLNADDPKGEWVDASSIKPVSADDQDDILKYSKAKLKLIGLRIRRGE